MSVIRWYMPFRDGVHSARVQHVHYAYVGEDGVNWPVGLSGRPHLCDI